MGHTPGVYEQNGVDCFSQQGEVLYAAQTAQKRNLMPPRHVDGVQAPPQTVFCFRVWGLGQQGSSNREFYRSSHFVNKPPGYTPISAKDLYTTSFCSYVCQVLFKTIPLFLKKNQTTPRPSEHPPVMGEKNVKTFRWDQKAANTKPLHGI